MVFRITELNILTLFTIIWSVYVIPSIYNRKISPKPYNTRYIPLRNQFYLKNKGTSDVQEVFCHYSNTHHWSNIDNLHGIYSIYLFNTCINTQNNTIHSNIEGMTIFLRDTCIHNEHHSVNNLSLGQFKSVLRKWDHQLFEIKQDDQSVAYHIFWFKLRI